MYPYGTQRQSNRRAGFIEVDAAILVLLAKIENPSPIGDKAPRGRDNLPTGKGIAQVVEGLQRKLFLIADGKRLRRHRTRRRGAALVKRHRVGLGLPLGIECDRLAVLVRKIRVRIPLHASPARAVGLGVPAEELVAGERDRRTFTDQIGLLVLALHVVRQLARKATAGAARHICIVVQRVTVLTRMRIERVVAAARGAGALVVHPGSAVLGGQALAAGDEILSELSVGLQDDIVRVAGAGHVIFDHLIGHDGVIEVDDPSTIDGIGTSLGAALLGLEYQVGRRPERCRAARFSLSRIDDVTPIDMRRHLTQGHTGVHPGVEHDALVAVRIAHLGHAHGRGIVHAIAPGEALELCRAVAQVHHGIGLATERDEHRLDLLAGRVLGRHLERADVLAGVRGARQNRSARDGGREVLGLLGPVIVAVATEGARLAAAHGQDGSATDVDRDIGVPKGGIATAADGMLVFCLRIRTHRSTRDRDVPAPGSMLVVADGGRALLSAVSGDVAAGNDNRLAQVLCAAALVRRTVSYAAPVISAVSLDGAAGDLDGFERCLTRAADPGAQATPLGIDGSALDGDGAVVLPKLVSSATDASSAIRSIAIGFYRTALDGNVLHSPIETAPDTGTAARAMRLDLRRALNGDAVDTAAVGAADTRSTTSSRRDDLTAPKHKIARNPIGVRFVARTDSRRTAVIARLCRDAARVLGISSREHKLRRYAVFLNGCTTLIAGKLHLRSRLGDDVDGPAVVLDLDGRT